MQQAHQHRAKYRVTQVCTAVFRTDKERDLTELEMLDTTSKKRLRQI